jgi:YidC/Oxa1 family membrane protein insertase
VFPIGVVVGAPFLPLAILIYWVSNNLWTLGQQYVVYRKIDAEQAEKKEQTVANRQALAPRPGQKPVRPEAKPVEEDTPEPVEAPAKKPGAKPVTRKQPAKGSTNGVASANGAPKNSTAKNGSGGTAGAGSSGAGSTPGARRPRKRR